MTTAAANLRIRGDIRDFKAAIADLPVETKKAALKAFKELERESRRVEKVLGQVAKPAGPSIKDTREGVEGLKTAMEALGGAGAPAADSVSKLLDGAMKLGAAAGPAGLAIGAATTAVVAFTGAGVTAALQAGELIRELDEMGRSDAITPEQREAVGAMDIAMRELRIATSEATIAFGTQFAPTITTVVQGLTEAVRVAGEASEAYSTFARVVGAIGSLGITEALGVFEEDTDGAARAAYKAEEAFRQQRVELEALATAYEDAESITPRVTQAVTRQAAAHRDVAAAAREQAAEQQRITAFVAGEIEKAQAAEVAAHREKLAQIRAAEEIEYAAREASRQLDLQRQAAAAEQALALAQEGMAALEAQVSSLPGAFLGLAETLGNIVAEQTERDLTRLDRIDQRERARVERALESGRIDERQAQQRLKAIEEETRAERRAINERDKARKRAAQAAFIAYKAGAIAQALISGANAYLAVLAAPPIAALGPFAPAAAAAVVAPVTAAQVASIAAQKSQLHEGGMVMSPGADDVPATLRRGEGVLTPAGVARAGGPAGVDALNSGGAGGMAGTTHLTVNLTMPSGEVATTTVRASGQTVNAVLRTSPGQRPYDGRR